MPGSHPSSSPVLGSSHQEANSSRGDGSVMSRHVRLGDNFFQPNHHHHIHQQHYSQYPNHLHQEQQHAGLRHLPEASSSHQISGSDISSNTHAARDPAILEHSAGTSQVEAFASRFSEFVRSSDRREVDYARPFESYIDEEEQFQSVLSAIANIQMGQRPQGFRSHSIATDDTEMGTSAHGQRLVQSPHDMQDNMAEILHSEGEDSDSAVEDIYDIRHLMLHSQRRYEAEMRYALEDYSQYEPSNSRYSDSHRFHQVDPSEISEDSVMVDLVATHPSTTSSFQTSDLSTAGAFAVENHMLSMSTPPPPTMISSSYFSPTMESTIVLSSPPPGRTGSSIVADSSTTPYIPLDVPFSAATTDAASGNGPYRRFVTGRGLGQYSRPSLQQPRNISSMSNVQPADAVDDSLDAQGARVLSGTNNGGTGQWHARGSVTQATRSFEQHRLRFYQQQQLQLHIQRQQAFLERQRQYYEEEAMDLMADTPIAPGSHFEQEVETHSGRTSGHTSQYDPHRRAPHTAMSFYPHTGPSELYPSNIPIPSRYMSTFAGNDSRSISPPSFRPHNIATSTYHHMNGYGRPSLGSFENSIDSVAARYRRRLAVDGQPQPYSETVERAEAGGWLGGNQVRGNTASVSSSTSTSTRYGNPLESTRSRNRYLEIGLKEVVRMACRFCESIICERGMKAQLLADQAIGLFSTDDAPQSGNTIGYHITQPCEKCLMAENNGHLWLFHPEYISSGPRVDPMLARQMRWEDLPSPEQDFDTLSIGKVLQAGPDGRVFVGGMAYESMAKYPTPFVHPIEALCLTGVGEKMVKQLETKLAEHCKANGLPMPTAKQAKKVRRTAPLAAVDVEEDAPKPKRPRAEKRYIPTLRSGPYAIMLALLDAKLRDGEGAMTKSQIIADGQTYTDTSLSTPEHGKFYTGWSSAKTLLGNNMIYQNGKHYYLTDQGFETAMAIRKSAQRPEGEQDALQITIPEVASAALAHQPNSMKSTSQTQSSSASSSSQSTGSISRTQSLSSQSTASSSRTHSFSSYDSTSITSVNPSNSSVSSHSRSTASSSRTLSNDRTATASPSYGFGSKQVAIPDNSRWRDVDYDFDSEHNDWEGSWLPARDSTMARSRSTYSPPTPSKSTTSMSRVQNGVASSPTKLPSRSLGTSGRDIFLDQSVMILSDDSEDNTTATAPTTIKTSSQPIPQPTTIPKRRSDSSRSVEDNDDDNDNHDNDNIPASKQPSRTKHSAALNKPNAAPVPVSNHDSFPHLKGVEPRKTTGSRILDVASLAIFQPAQFLPGTFDIVMILDIREVRGLSDRDYIDQKLMEHGVDVEKRALDIGDALWIARLHNPPAFGPNEIVLNYVIERKRMDDLVSSIKDGRFLEQKFRLKRSGIEHVIYLVENYKTDETYDIGVEAIRTSQTSTQVSDGFFVKRTNHTDETIEYFASITNELKRMHLNKTLYAIPDDSIDRATYLELRDYLRDVYPGRDHLTSYDGFCRLNSKSNAVVVRDVFVKMLMTIRGVSAEKAAEIAKTYSTPRRLFSNLDEGGPRMTLSARRKLVARTNSGGGRKKIGPAVSAKVADIWYLEEPGA
ncbi:Crossover junction endonuclease mus81 [Podila humilis]|nr:Crossover junction endonuclease mus81 [Podila humilis]